MDLISLVIINYNNKSFLKRCINSILNQTYSNLEIIFIDNESADGSFDYMKEEYLDKDILLIRNEKNNGYAGAANQGIKISNGKYVMIINPDIIMEEDFIANLYSYIITDNTIGAISGKLLKYDFDNSKKLNYIDSAGIIMFRNRRCIDRGQNQEDVGQYDNIERVFGVCGAAPMYRKDALEKIKFNSEYFDEDFFAYKEDIDLSWRMNLVGYKNIYYPKAVAYHGRGLGSSNGGKINFIKNRKIQSEFLRGISTRNHLLLLMKNETDQTFSRDKIKIIIREIEFFIYSLFFERFNFKYLKQAIKMKNKMLIKKQNTMARRNITDKELFELFK